MKNWLSQAGDKTRISFLCCFIFYSYQLFIRVTHEKNHTLSCTYILICTNFYLLNVRRPWGNTRQTIASKPGTGDHDTEETQDEDSSNHFNIIQNVDGARNIKIPGTLIDNIFEVGHRSSIATIVAVTTYMNELIEFADSAEIRENDPF